MNVRGRLCIALSIMLLLEIAPFKTFGEDPATTSTIDNPTTSTIDNPTKTESYQKLKPKDQFEILRNYRNKVVFSLQDSTAQAKTVDAQLKDALNAKADHDRRQPFPIPSKEKVQAEIATSKESISADQQKLDSMDKKADPTGYSNLESEIQDLKRQCKTTQTNYQITIILSKDSRHTINKP
jgi:hypothetical protein